MKTKKQQLKSKLEFAIRQNPKGEWQKWAKDAEIKYKLIKTKGVKI